MMLRLRISKTLFNSAQAAWFLGPGILVLSEGPEGSLGKKGVSEPVGRVVANALVKGTRLKARRPLVLKTEAIVI